MQVNSIRDQLDQAGLPMTDSQRTEMLAAVTEESQRLPRPTLGAGTAPEDGRAQMMQWQTDYDKALLDRAKQVLNTEQYNAYKEYQDWQTEMRNSMPMPVQGGPGAMRVGVVGAGAESATIVATPLSLLSAPPEKTDK